MRLDVSAHKAVTGLLPDNGGTAGTRGGQRQEMLSIGALQGAAQAVALSSGCAAEDAAWRPAGPALARPIDMGDGIRAGKHTGLAWRRIGRFLKGRYASGGTLIGQHGHLFRWVLIPDLLFIGRSKGQG